MSASISRLKVATAAAVLALLIVLNLPAHSQTVAAKAKSARATKIGGPLQSWMAARRRAASPHGIPSSQVATHDVSKGGLPPAAALFNVPLTYPSGTATENAAVGDFNGDGIPDVAVASYYNSVAVMLGNSDGSLQPFVSYSLLGNYQFNTLGDEALAVGDFNADGKLDIIVADTCPSDSGGVCITTSGTILNPGSGMVSVVLGNGDGTFQTAQNFSSGVSGSAIVVGDFNGDGKLDAAVAGYGAVDILLGNGDGTFGAPLSYTITAGPEVYGLAVGDLNHDGKLDLVVSLVFAGQNPSNDGEVVVMLGKGNGTFPTQVAYPTGVATIQPVIADLNGDGHPDIVATNLGVYQTTAPTVVLGSVSVLLGDGDGTFQNQVQYPTGYGTWSAAAVDFNGDGKLDVTVTNQTESTVGILLGNGDGTLQPQLAIGSGATPLNILPINLTGAKLPGLITSDGDTVAVYQNNGSGSVASYVMNGGAGNGAAGAIDGFPGGVTADFNGDGKLDVAVADYGGDSYNEGVDNLPLAGGATVMSGNGDGTFTSPAFYPIYASDSATSIAFGDLRGDGKLDLIVGGQFFGTYVFLGNGDGTFQNYQQLPGNGTDTLALGDFNNDGKLDLVIGDYNNYDDQDNQLLLALYLGNGDGTFAGAIPIIPESTAGGINIEGVAVADFNNDGNLDIAATDSGHNDVLVFLGNGHGSFKAPVPYPSDLDPNGIVIGDINGDGKLDLVVANETSANGPTVGIFFGNGDGSFQQQVSIPVPTSYMNSLRLTDLNGDGKLDIVFPNVGVMLGNGDGTFQQFVGFVAGDSNDVIAADFNGDGAIDLAAVALEFGVKEASNVDVLINTMGGKIQPSASTTVLTASPNPVVDGATVVLRATVTTAGQAGTGTVTFKYGSEAIGKCVLANGSCTFAAATSSVPPGTYNITAAYPGSTTYLASVSPAVKVVVASASSVATTTTLTVSPTSVIEGNAVMFTAAVTATSGTANGNVTFSYGSDALGSCALADGSCTFSHSTAGIPPGNYSVTAKYVGSGNYLTSTSPPVAVVVEPTTIATTTVLTATPNPLAEGSTISLMATVNAASGTAVGTVNFFYGGTSLGSCTLAVGNCSFYRSTAGIPPGTYAIDARYLGSSNYLASTSAKVNVVVSSGDVVHTTPSVSHSNMNVELSHE